MTEPERLRFSAREDVLFNPAISAGACRLYMALDSMAGFKGQCWPRQSALAERLGISQRMLRYWLTELRDLVSLVHRRGANIYLLLWADPGRKPIVLGRQSVAEVVPYGRQWVAGDVGNGLPSYSNQEIESEKKQARELIEQYPYAQNLSGRPSDALVAGCLDDAGGLDGLADACRLMYRAGKRPDRSWGWFPIVLQSYVRRRA